jgi:uncharacterized membrane protein YjgN (DUF898 family)
MVTGANEAAVVQAGPAAAAPPATIPPKPAAIGYLQKPGLWKLVIKNLLLSVITIGIYRFWARAGFRRYFWSNMTIAGEPLEYTGTGRELFIGFLIALAVLVPLGILYAVIERLTLGDLAAAIALRVVYVLGLATLIQVAIFRARRYRLSRTAWRGIRAGQSGSTWRYVGRSAVWGLLMIVTLGLAVPWADVALERYKINHSWFGDARFSLEAKALRLFPRWLLVLGVFYLPIIVAFLANLSGLEAMIAAGMQQQPPPPPPYPQAFLLIFVSIFAGFPAVLWYRVASFRYLASTTRLGPIHLTSRARGGAVLGIIAIYLFGLLVCFLALLGLIMLLAVPIGAAFAVAAQSGEAPPVGVIAIVILVVLAFLVPATQLLNYCWLRQQLLRHLATTLSIEDVGALERIAQSTLPRQKFGEGLADSFDIGQF